MPDNKALQGHLKAGHLWETMIGSILADFNFQNTDHEHNLYCGTTDGQMVLVCCQVDDFTIASADLGNASDWSQ